MTDHVVDFEPGTHTYGLDGVPVISVTQVLKEASIIDTKWFTAWGKHRGSTVHRAVQLLVEGTLDLNSIDPKIQGYLDAYERFRDETGFEVLEAERLVRSISGRYAGRLDQLGTIKGATILADLKTGALNAATGLQLTGYADAYGEETGKHVDRLLGIQLMVDGRYKLKPYIADFPAWRAALGVAWWKRENL